MRQNTVGVESVNLFHGHVIHGFLAVGHDAYDLVAEALAVEVAGVPGEFLGQAGSLPGLTETHTLCKDGEVAAADDQFVLGLGGVFGAAALAVGQGRGSSEATLGVEAAHDAEARKHPLGTLQQAQIRLREAHAHALALGALHAAVGVEQAL